MLESDLDQFIEQYHQAVAAFIRGDPEPNKRVFSRRDDVTLANPLGPPGKGRQAVEQIMDRASSQLRDGEFDGWDRIVEYESGDLGFIVEIERARIKVGGSADMAPVPLRVTTIFRREDGEWKVLHRHADPIVTPRPIESLLER